jgi:predicted outer membrane protein
MQNKFIILAGALLLAISLNAQTTTNSTPPISSGTATNGSGVAGNQNTNQVVSTNQVPPTNPSPADARWLAKAAESSLNEITLGNLARSNSLNPDVQSFGATLVADQTAAYQTAQEIGTNDGIAVPTTETPPELGADGRLSRLPGARFDAAFLKLIVKDQIRDIQSFETEAEVGRVADVRSYAITNLPVLMEHLVTALSLEESLGISLQARH